MQVTPWPPGTEVVGKYDFRGRTPEVGFYQFISIYINFQNPGQMQATQFKTT